MSDTPKSGKKDQSVRREAIRDIEEEPIHGSAEPVLKHPNRDQARGDWDRTGRRTDEEA
jgi:hypothetical protein